MRQHHARVAVPSTEYILGDVMVRGAGLFKANNGKRTEALVCVMFSGGVVAIRWMNLETGKMSDQTPKEWECQAVLQRGWTLFKKKRRWYAKPETP